MPESQRILVYDNFYDNADEVRSLALQQSFSRKSGATYPGREVVVSSRDWMPIWQRMRDKIEEPCDVPCPKPIPFPQGKFRLALASDEDLRLDRVHVDQQRWSGIVYLTLPKDCRSGLVLYRNRHIHVIAGQLIDQSELLGTIGGLDEAFAVPTGRGDEAVHGGGAGIDSRDDNALRHAARDIYIPDLHIDTIAVKPRNFR